MRIPGAEEQYERMKKKNPKIKCLDKKDTRVPREDIHYSFTEVIQMFMFLTDVY